MALKALSEALREVRREFEAVRAAAARPIAPPARPSLGGTGAGSDRARAESIARNLRPQEIAALKKKLGL